MFIIFFLFLLMLLPFFTIFTLSALSAFSAFSAFFDLLEHFHFLLEVFSGSLIYVSSGDALDNGLMFDFRLPNSDYIFDAFFGFFLFVLGNHHTFQFVYFMEVVDEQLYELELELFLDDLVADVGTGD